MSLFGLQIAGLLGPHMNKIRELADQGDSYALQIKAIHQKCRDRGTTLEEDYDEVVHCLAVILKREG